MNSKGFKISIKKEQLADLPTVEYRGDIVVIETQEAAIEALEYLKTCEMVGFDTETKPNFRKGRKNTLSLIQVSTPDRSFLFRINKFGLPKELIDFIESEDILKIGLSLKDDFHMLRQLGEFEPKNFIDLQDVVKTYHISDCSLQKIYGILFDARISKGQRLSNWEAETLSPAQMAYASIDAWACLKIYNKLAGGEFRPEESPYRLTEDT